MKKSIPFSRILAVLMAMLLLVTGWTMPAAAQQSGSGSVNTFAEQFQSPDGSAKPGIRWWVSPGSMEEEETRREIREMAEGGYGRIEVCELSGATLGTGTFVKVMKWALDEAVKYGIQLDFNISTGATIVYPDKGKADKDDELSEQGIFCAAEDFTSTSDSPGYRCDAFPMPAEYQASGMFGGTISHGFEPGRLYTFVAATAARKNADGSYDASSVVDITDQITGLVSANDVTGASLSWQAPSEGDWTVFYHYQQATAIEMTLFGVYDMTKVIVDHLSSEAALEMMGYWQQMMDSDPEFAALMVQNGGDFFGDSLEIGGNVMAGAKRNFAMWTWDILDAFEELNGYDLTPYLPVIFIDDFYPTYGHKVSVDDAPNYEFGEMGDKVRKDYFATLTELFANEHVKVIREWAEEHNMGLRYQVYGQVFDLTEPSLQASGVENESRGGVSGDYHRVQSGIVHMNVGGNGIYSTESASVPNLGWAQSWTGAYRADHITAEGEDYWSTGNPSKSDTGVEDAGLLRIYNSQMAVGFNQIMMHGFSYRSENAWPGSSTMVDNGNSTEWDDKTPMWEHIDELTGYLSRAQYVMQQGSADMDLAIYRKAYSEGSTVSSYVSEANSLEYTGFSYDYVSPGLLRLENAVVSEQNGKTVLAANGPSYQALVLDQRLLADGSGDSVASDMPLDVAQKVLGYAKAGLPIVIVGEAPSETGTFGGSIEAAEAQNAELAGIMAEVAALETTVTIETRDEIPSALASLGVEPDVKRDYPSTLLNLHRADTDADFYYLYNSDFNHALTQTVSLKGEGTPYLLNAWTGEITPIAQYDAENGRITLQVELQPNAAMLIAIARNGFFGDVPADSVVDTDADSVVYDAEGNLAARVTDAGEYRFALSDGQAFTAVIGGAPEAFELDQWTMVLESWTANDSSREALKTQMGPYELEELIPWNEIEGLETAAGIATYETTFYLEEGWEDGLGAMVDFGYVSDTMKVWVNGEEVSGVDMIANQADIGPYLVKGKNTITVEVASTLGNSKSKMTFEYGLVGPVVVTPYRQAVLTIPETEPVKSASAPESVQVGSDFTVTIVTAASIADVRLYNEYDMAISSKAVEVSENEDGTKTWNLTVSAGTVGNGRTFKIVAKGSEGYDRDSGKTVSLDITSIPPVLTSFDLPDSAVANRTFIVKAATDMAATKIEVYNEYGARMGLKSLSCKVVDGQKVWTGVMAIGTKGDRTFTAYAVNKYGAPSGALTDTIRVKAYA